MTRSTALAVVSLGAAAIHFAVIPDHLAEWWAFGLFFAVLGWFQALWAVGYVVGPSVRLARVALWVNLGTVVLWAWTRTIGLPLGPTPGMPERIGAPDVVATLFELALVIGLSMAWSPAVGGTEDARAVRWPAIGLVAALVAVATTTSMALGGG